MKIAKVKKNATLNNLISKYLEKHPDKKRPSSEIEELEKLNKITNDVVEVLDPKQSEQHPQSLFGYPQLPLAPGPFLYSPALNIGSFLVPGLPQGASSGNNCAITS